jgi:hypothetical protein
VKPISDLYIDVPPLSTDEFAQKWSLLVKSKAGGLLRAIRGEDYSYYYNTEPPEFPPAYDTAKVDEQLAIIAELNPVGEELRQLGREAFLEKYEFSNKRIYQSWLIELARLWRHVNPPHGKVRRIWYKGFKRFAQQLRGSEFSESDYSNLSSSLADMVKSGLLNYSDLFVQDTTRKMFRGEYNRHIGFFNVVLACEKDSVVDELVQLGDSVGADLLISGKGNPSLAASEKALLLHQYRQIKEENPDFTTIFLAIISDYDHAGVGSVAGGFIQQFQTICNILDLKLVYKRVGLLPHHVPEARLTPEFALYAPNYRAVIRCTECYEWEHVCNACGKKHSKNSEGTPRLCTKRVKGRKCNASDFTSMRVHTKVQNPTSRNGFLTAAQYKQMRSGMLSEQEILDGLVCEECGCTRLKIHEEANPWFQVYGVPWCTVHETVHCTDYTKFNDEACVAPEDCNIRRYGIELDALGASYYFSEIAEWLIEVVGMEVVDEYARRETLPSAYDYDSLERDVAHEFATSESEDYRRITHILKELDDVREKLETRQEEMIDEIREHLTTLRHQLVVQENWDDRERVWDSDTNSWDSDSMRTLHETQARLIREAVRRGRQARGYESVLNIRKSPLILKTKNALQDDLRENPQAVSTEKRFDAIRVALIDENDEEVDTTDE